MDAPTNHLLLKRNVVIRTIVTPTWKEQTQQQFQSQINQIDGQIQQLELQGRQAIAEVQKQGATSNTDVKPQLDSIQTQVNNQKSQLLEQKNQLLQQLNRVQVLELEQQVEIGQIESFFTLKQGDNLYNKMQVEILLKDGVVQEVRGDI